MNLRLAALMLVLGAAATDVMKNVVGHSFMVHSGAQGSPGAKIACGVITLDG